jgi:hypothetical protein
MLPDVLLLLLLNLVHPTFSNHFRPDSACTTTSVPIAGYTKSITTSTGETRCFTVYRPETAPTPTPVVVYFHDRGEDAIECGRVGGEFVRQAYRDGFALVCAEAADLGDWRFGNYGIVNDNNANPCTASQVSAAFTFPSTHIAGSNLLRCWRTHRPSTLFFVSSFNLVRRRLDTFRPTWKNPTWNRYSNTCARPKCPIWSKPRPWGWSKTPTSP